MASSIPAALDYLVTQIRALPAAAASVVVSDGWPAERGDTLIVVGIDSEDGDSDITKTYAELSGDEYEDVEVPCMVWTRRAGAESMKVARDAAFTIFDAIRALVKSDRRLGGAVTTGLPARVARYTLSQTANVRQAGEGRACEIRFVVAWRHRG